MPFCLYLYMCGLRLNTNHEMGIREIPKTQLGWLRQRLHTIRTERLAEWQAGRQNAVLARGKLQVIYHCPYSHYSMQFVRGLPMFAIPLYCSPLGSGFSFSKQLHPYVSTACDWCNCNTKSGSGQSKYFTFLYVSVEHLIKQLLLNCWGQVFDVWHKKKKKEYYKKWHGEHSFFLTSYYS